MIILEDFLNAEKNLQYFMYFWVQKWSAVYTVYDIH